MDQLPNRYTVIGINPLPLGFAKICSSATNRPKLQKMRRGSLFGVIFITIGILVGGLFISTPSKEHLVEFLVKFVPKLRL